MLNSGERSAAGDLAYVSERIHRPGVGGSRGGDDEPGAQSGGLVFLDRLLKGLGVHSTTCVHRYDRPSRLTEASDADRLIHRVVDVIGQVDHRALEIPGLQTVGIPCGDDPAKVGDTASRAQAPRGALRVSHQIGHPIEEHVLHAHRPGALEENAGMHTNGKDPYFK